MPSLQPLLSQPVDAVVRRPPGAATAVNKLLLKPAVKPLLFVIFLLPLAWLVYGAVTNTLGANPAEALIRASGDWTLRFLCLTLAVTPLRTLTGCTPWQGNAE